DRPVMSPENQRFALAQEYPRVVRIAQPRRRFDQGIEHRLEVEGRAADHLEHVGGGGLLFPRLVQLAGEPRDLGFLTSNGGTAMACSLKGFCLAASRLSRFAACSGAPSHRPPKAQDYADFQRGLQQGFAAGGMGFRGQFAQQQSEIANVRFGSKADIEARLSDVSALPPKADIAEGDRHFRLVPKADNHTRNSSCVTAPRI